MTNRIPDSLERFDGELHRALTRELAGDTGNARRRTALGRRPRVLAGGALGLAGAATAAVLALGGATAPPALAVTQQSNGSVLVSVDLSETTAPWLQAANSKLASMGVDEQILINANPTSDPQPAAASPVSCTPISGASSPSGPPIKIAVSGQVPAGNTGAGSTGITGCSYMSTTTADSSSTTAG